MHENLYEIFLNVNEWLKFAEAKHSGLIVLNSGLVLGLAAIFKDVHKKLNKHLLFIASFCFTLSISISLISFFPSLNHIEPRHEIKRLDNFYYFGSICNIDTKCFEDHLSEIDKSYTLTKFDRDMIGQIIVNSNITNSKMQLFKLALGFCFGGILILMTSITAKYIWHF